MDTLSDSTPKSKAQHTPGPWTHCRGVKQTDFQEHDTVQGSDEWDVAHVEERTKDGEQHANARLIAAAPELLEALKLTLSEMEAMHALHHPRCEGGCSYFEAHEAACAAIAASEPV